MMLSRSPDFGNRFRLIPNTRIHRIMSGEARLLQGNAPQWESFFGHYSALTLDDITTFKTWVTQSFGTQIQISDFEGRTWSGIIVSPSIPIFKGRAGCNYSTEFDFEGVIVP